MTQTQKKQKQNIFKIISNIKVGLLNLKITQLLLLDKQDTDSVSPFWNSKLRCSSDWKCGPYSQASSPQVLIGTTE